MYISLIRGRKVSIQDKIPHAMHGTIAIKVDIAFQRNHQMIKFLIQCVVSRYHLIIPVLMS
jgi:hypothetical protein